MSAKKTKTGFSSVYSLEETTASQSALDKAFPEAAEHLALQVVQDVRSDSAQIAVTGIVANPFQPRKRFDQEKLQELAASIREDGVLQPVVVRRSPTRAEMFELAAGERRWRAAILAGLETIPARILQECSNAKMRRIALIENTQREQLSPLELAETYRAILDERDDHGQPLYSIRSLAEMLKKHPDHVDSHLALLRVPADVRRLIEEDESIPLRVIRELGSVEEPDDRAALVEEVRRRTLNQADIVEILKELKKGKRRQKDALRVVTGDPAPQPEVGVKGVAPLTQVTRTVLVRKLNRDRGAVRKTLDRIAVELQTLDLEGRQLVRTHLETMAEELQALIGQC
jgi:ParB family transcriptional regulator, chromosome partitioning protein